MIEPLRNRIRIHAISTVEGGGDHCDISIENEHGEHTAIAHGVPWTQAHALRAALDGLFELAQKAQAPPEQVRRTSKGVRPGAMY